MQNFFSLFNQKSLFIQQIPNTLTALRVIFIFPTLYLLKTGYILESFFLALFVFITDFLDGKIARKLSCSSDFGAIFDPIADKFVTVFFFSFFFIENKIPNYYFSLLFLRDFLQLLSIPILLLWKKRSFKVKPKFIGKYGTAIKFVILIYLFLQYFDFMNLAYIKFLYQLILLSSIFSEIYILVTFIPRFLQIYLGKHDTFE